MSMESRPRSKPVKGFRLVTALLAGGLLCLLASPLTADTYRWKDKDGKIHYGASVPPEYADQPYDVLNSAGIVIEHVEDTSVPETVRVEQKIQERAPLISEEERERQADRLLVIQYRSEDEILEALDLEIAQLGYDSRLVKQSYESTSMALREQIRQAANQQRANQPIGADQQKGIEQLYARLASDEQKGQAIQRREDQIRERFEADLERYRYLTAEDESADDQQPEQN